MFAIFSKNENEFSNNIRKALEDDSPRKQNKDRKLPEKILGREKFPRCLVLSMKI
jgi:hypothetical protein